MKLKIGDTINGLIIPTRNHTIAPNSIFRINLLTIINSLFGKSTFPMSFGPDSDNEVWRYFKITGMGEVEGGGFVVWGKYVSQKDLKAAGISLDAAIGGNFHHSILKEDFIGFISGLNNPYPGFNINLQPDRVSLSVPAS